MEDLGRILEQPEVRRLRELVEGRDDAILLLADRYGKLLWGSAFGSRTIFGRTPDQYVGTTALEFLHPEDVDRVAAALVEVARSTENRKVTYRATDDAGGWVKVRSVFWPIVSPDGERIVVGLTVPVR